MKKEFKSSIFDSVYKTEIHDGSGDMVLPMIREVFGEDYGGKELVFLKDKMYIYEPEGGWQMRETDSLCRVKDEEDIYHFECQSRPDGSMLLRMYEYDSQVAKERRQVSGETAEPGGSECQVPGEVAEPGGSECQVPGEVAKFAGSGREIPEEVSELAGDGRYIAQPTNFMRVKFPKSAVLYLRHSKRTPDCMTIEIVTGAGATRHRVHILKLGNYSLADIEQKRLFVLIPFQILLYEKEILLYNKTKKRVKEARENVTKDEKRELARMRAELSAKLTAHYGAIVDMLERSLEAGTLDNYLKNMLIELLRKVTRHVTSDCSELTKGAEEMMGGVILDYEAKRILNRGVKQGMEQGVKQGMEQGVKQGMKQGALSAYVDLIKDGVISIMEAAKRLGMTEEEVKALL